MSNPFQQNLIKPLPGLDMATKPKAAKVGAVGLKGPWHLDPGNPAFPNHRPYLTNIQAPNEAAPVKPAQLKFT